MVSLDLLLGFSLKTCVVGEQGKKRNGSAPIFANTIFYLVELLVNREPPDPSRSYQAGSLTPNA
jgi:hypothetical protein